MLYRRVCASDPRGYCKDLAGEVVNLYLHLVEA
jgi:hypothetical protein